MSASSTYIALLRGVNVGSHYPLAMDALKQLCLGLQLQQVSTYLRSGNVVFAAQQVNPPVLAQQLEQAIEAHCGFAVPVQVWNLTQWQTMVQANPLLPEHPLAHLHVTLLAHQPALEGVQALQVCADVREQWALEGCALYLSLPNGYGRTKLTNNKVEAALHTPATTRNWRTVQALLYLGLATATRAV